MESRQVNWREEYRGEWEFTGAYLVFMRECERLENCPHDTSGYCDKCDIYPHDRESENYPMMNYAYPLKMSNISKEKVLEICDRTNLTVVYNHDEHKYYMALTGGGMDLSQDIALAYVIAHGRIPFHLLIDVNSQPMLSIGRDEWLTVADSVIDGLENAIGMLQQKKETWEKERAKVKEAQ